MLALAFCLSVLLIDTCTCAPHSLLQPHLQMMIVRIVLLIQLPELTSPCPELFLPSFSTV